MFLADRPLHDKSPQPLSRIQQLELREQVHQTVACRRARKPHYPFQLRTDFHKGLEPLRLVVLERRKLVNYRHIEINAMMLGSKHSDSMFEPLSEP